MEGQCLRTGERLESRKKETRTNGRRKAAKFSRVAALDSIARSLSPRGIPEGDFFRPLADSASDKVLRRAGAERVTRPFVNNLVKVAKYRAAPATLPSSSRCLSKALLESGKKLTGRLPVTLMLAYNVPRYFQRCDHIASRDAST